MHRLVPIATVASVLAAAAFVTGCESKKKTSTEEAPIRRGSTPDQQRPPKVDPHASTPPAPPPAAPGGSVAPTAMPGHGAVTPPGSAGLAMDTVRAPVAADLPVYLAQVKGTGTLTATIETTMGTFHCALFEKEVPMTVANFVGLATGQKPWIDPSGNVQKHKPFFDGLGFHRVIPQFMIQGGDPLGEGTGGPGYNFADEFVPSLRMDGPGVLAMANSGPATNGSQFFITEIATAWLNGRHTVFGKCKEGDLVAKMTATAGPGDRPAKPIVMTKVTIARM